MDPFRYLCFMSDLSFPCNSPVVLCWERAGILAILCMVFACVFVTFPYDNLGQVW